MEPHSLALLSVPSLEHSHIGPQSAHRRPPQTPLLRPGRPFRFLSRLFPQLRQFNRQLRQGDDPEAPGVVQARWGPATDKDAHGPSVAVAQAGSQHVRAPRRRPWHRRQQQAVVVITHHHLPRPARLAHQNHEPSEQLYETVQHGEESSHHEGDRQMQVEHQRPQGPLRRLRRVLRFMARRLQPQGPGDNDKTLPERVLNVATCGMFFHAGRRIVRLCHSAAARRFGWAFVAVGAAATVYHGCWGRFRPLARKVDYYAIAASSLLLRAAALGPAPRWLAAAMVLTVPFRPTLVSTTNFTAVEIRYLLLALSHPALLPQWAAHTGLSVAATVCFSLEDVPPLSWCPYTHAGFHVLSAAAFLTLPGALNHLTAARATALAA